MDEALEIAFHNLPSSAAVEAAIRERFAKLERLYDRVVACSVSVESLHRQHRSGNLYEVHIDILVPGAEIVASKPPSKARDRYANPDVYVSLREAFDAAERQVKRFKRQKREDLQPGEVLVVGRVAETHPDQDWGYLLGNDGTLLYFHRNAVLEDGFDKLQRGDVVHYIESMGETGPTAVKVWTGREQDATGM